jgi:hypothetical protein
MNEGPVLPVFDYKNGAGVFVSAINNLQERIYAAAILRHYAELLAHVQEIHTHIIQPRHPSKADKWRVDRISRADLDAWVTNELDPAIARTQADDAPLCAGEWCHETFCPRRFHAGEPCPALLEFTKKRTRGVFASASTRDPGAKVPAKVMPDPCTIPLEKLDKVLRAAPVVRKFLDQAENHAFQLALKGVEIPGHKLVEKQGNRAWVDEDAARAALVEAGVDPMQPGKMKSPAQAEKALGKAKKGIVGGLVHKPAKGPTLVPLSDKRPPYTPAVKLPKLTD